MILFSRPISWLWHKHVMVPSRVLTTPSLAGSSPGMVDGIVCQKAHSRGALQVPSQTSNTSSCSNRGSNDHPRGRRILLRGSRNSSRRPSRFPCLSQDSCLPKHGNSTSRVPVLAGGNGHRYEYMCVESCENSGRR